MFILSLFVIARSWKQPGYPTIGEWTHEIWFIFTVEYYSVIKSFAGKCMELENIPNEVTQTPKRHAWYILTNKWILAEKKSTEYPGYNPQYSCIRAQVRMPPLGRKKKAITEVGAEGKEEQGHLLGGWNRTEALRARRKNGNRQPQKVGGGRDCL
jgi:hypothetical protein